MFARSLLRNTTVRRSDNLPDQILPQNHTMQIMADPDTAIEQPWQRQHLHVPREDGELFASLTLAESIAAAARNYDSLSTADTDIQGRTLAHLRSWTRSQTIKAAAQYTARMIDAEPEFSQTDRVFVAGHQPALYHPGVWVKNFALDRLAGAAPGVGINLIVDNDTFSTRRVRIPAGTANQPVLESVAFDDERPTQPWEDARVANPARFADFGQNVAAGLERWNITPLAAGQFWQDAVAMQRQSHSVAECLTVARMRLERRWGLHNLEYPISQLCQLDPFLWFAGHILAHLPRFQEVHNTVLMEYRELNGVRSRTHPVPELIDEAGWLEAPFWVWRTGDTQRRRVFARPFDREIHLSDGSHVFAKLPLSPEMDACCAVEVLRELPAQGIHLRTRALTTTLFTRLCLADMFIHGIGGAKYDEMTDRIISRFFQLPAPQFLTMSAALHLPLATPDARAADETRRLQNLLRDLQYNPQRHLSVGTDATVDSLLAEKAALIAEQHLAESAKGLTHRERRQRRAPNYQRFKRLQEITRQLSQYTTSLADSASTKLADAQRRLRDNAVLQNREFAYCLFPEDKIRNFMMDVWNA